MVGDRKRAGRSHARTRGAWAHSVLDAEPSGTSAPAEPSVGLVHDYLLVMRGAERTFAELASVWPSAPVHTLLYDPVATQGRFARRTVHASALQSLDVDQRSFRRLLPLMPWAVSRLDLSDHELVVSSSSSFAHGVNAPPDAIHVCYCHSPFRYAWHERELGRSEVPLPMRPPLDVMMRGMREWDRRRAARPTRYVANSRVTRERIRRFWGRDAEVVHPPVDIHRFSPREKEDFVLFVGELVAHKRVGVALEAARRAGVRIKVVGDGPMRVRVEREYGRSAEFLGRVDDEELAVLYGQARALIVPNTEEFGIAAVEAQAAGTPVLAARAGGALETVIEGTTGFFFSPDDPLELSRLLRDRAFDALSPAQIRSHVSRFSAAAFRHRMRRTVEAIGRGDDGA